MKCDIAKKCGSCQFINQGYVKSLEYKNEECKKIFKDLKVNVHPVSGMEDPYYYRNKTIIAFDKTYNYGLYEENSHRIIPYKSCLIHDQETDAIISKIAVLFRKYRVSIYDPQRRRGEIRHILIRRAVKTNQTLVVIVSNEAIFKGSKNFCNQLVKAFPSIKEYCLKYK
jgi:23S rRNA (uracil1939-C5)-methyltransferase